jgi:hypothetical protein
MLSLGELTLPFDESETQHFLSLGGTFTFCFSLNILYIFSSKLGTGRRIVWWGRGINLVWNKDYSIRKDKRSSLKEILSYRRKNMLNQWMKQHAPAGKKNCQMAFFQKKKINLSNGEIKNGLLPRFSLCTCMLYKWIQSHVSLLFTLVKEMFGL